MSDNINLSPREKNLLTEILYDEKQVRSRKHMDTWPIDSLIDKALGRVTLHRREDKVLSLSDDYGVSTDISIGGTFESEHGMFSVQDIDGCRVKVGGLWYQKSEFEPATVTSFRGHMGMER